METAMLVFLPILFFVGVFYLAIRVGAARAEEVVEDASMVRVAADQVRRCITIAEDVKSLPGIKPVSGFLHYVHKGHRHAAARRARVAERLEIASRKCMTVREFNNE